MTACRYDGASGSVMTRPAFRGLTIRLKELRSFLAHTMRAHFELTPALFVADRLILWPNFVMSTLCLSAWSIRPPQTWNLQRVEWRNKCRLVLSDHISMLHSDL
jgi:hypothetical protein